MPGLRFRAMADVWERLRTRIFPALLTAAGVTMLAAGLLSYTTPVAAEPRTVAEATPSPTPAATPSTLMTLPPLRSMPPATATPTADPDRVATRIRIAALDIDLPVVKGPDGYPLCNVAMYLKELHQPGQGKATYIYAHAREGMFLPLLETPAKRQKGMVVEVWTSDDYRFLYEVVEVRRDQRNLDEALAADTEQLWLQTSEGPRGTPGKTQLIARPISVESADPADAHPTPKPVTCG
jgi:Sortase domain